MRLRRLPQAKSFIMESPMVLTEKDARPGLWRALLSIPQDGVLNLEIGMGRGRFVADACLREKGEGFLALEIREEMIYIALGRLKGEMPPNLRFLWLNAQLLGDAFQENELDRIFLHFPDPWPKARHTKRRLTHDDFLAHYRKVLSPSGCIVFKTDDREFYFWSRERFLENGWRAAEESEDLPLINGMILTEYEERYRNLGLPIYYLLLKKS